ncbi:hypothetical protein ACLQ3H_18475 [Micromonospora saelicesensis]|uniref:hypothetical protein n=1 Tax=Micromonospora saelicesensis TaxID=285676 RepID=UPI003CF89F88
MTRPMSMLEELGLLIPEQRLTRQFPSGMPDGAPPPLPAFVRDPTELIDRSGIALRSGYLQNGFVAAREADPDLTLLEYLAGGGFDSIFRGVVDDLLGHASATMLRTIDAARYVRALQDVYREFRAVPTPFDGGVAYASYRYQTGLHVELPENLNVLPMNAPIVVGSDLRYPAYGGVVTARGHRAIGTVMAGRAWGRDISLTARGKELFNELGLESRDVLHGWDYDPDLLMSEVQIAHMISTGEGPAYRFQILSGPPRPRARSQARWELAARLGDDAILDADEAGLQRLWKSHGSDAARRTGDPTNLSTRYGRDPYYRFSRDELFEMALGLPHAIDVRDVVYEWEHARPQRFIREMQRWVRRLGDQLPETEDFWSSRLSMLTGASEPGNLQLLSPYEHARTDLVAGRMFGGATRVDRYANRAVATIAGAEEYDLAARAADYASKSGKPLSAFSLTDLARAEEPIVAFDQHTLAELTAALQEHEWQAAVRATTGAQADWNNLVRRLNAQLVAYGMPKALLLPTI